MKFLSSLIALLFSFNLMAQTQHFNMYAELRLDGDLVYCDLKAAEEYKVSSMQFGFHHDTEFSSLMDITSDVIDMGSNQYNEICPTYVRIVWVHPMGQYVTFKKDETIMTMVYQLHKAEPHYICMMESGNDQCKNFYREVTNENVQPYMVGDVCVKFKTENGQILITQIREYLDSKASVFYNPQDEVLHINVPELKPDYKLNFIVADVNGKIILKEKLESGLNRLSMSGKVSGTYIYSFIKDEEIVRSEKFIKP